MKTLTQQAFLVVDITDQLVMIERWITGTHPEKLTIFQPIVDVSPHFVPTRYTSIEAAERAIARASYWDARRSPHLLEIYPELEALDYSYSNQQSRQGKINANRLYRSKFKVVSAAVSYEISI